MNPLFIVTVLVLGGLSFAIARFIPGSGVEIKLQDKEKDLEEAKKEADRIYQGAKEKEESIKRTFKEEEDDLKRSITSLNELIEQKEQLCKRRTERNKNFEQNVQKIQKEAKTFLSEAEEIKLTAMRRLSKVADLDQERALEQVKTELEMLITDGKEQRMETELEEFQEDILRHASAVLQVAIQRLGVQSSVDKNTTTLHFKNDKFLGMMAGKNGKNVAFLESLLPVSIIFNHAGAKSIHIGGLNLLQRNIAKHAILKLEKQAIKKQGITHSMIKDAVSDAEIKIMRICDEKGRWALRQLGKDPNDTPKELVNYIGRLYFRTSYGQNIIHHSLEMAFAARLIAELIGSDVETAMMGTFYHDIGKAIDHDIGGSHDDISKEILEKHGFDSDLVRAAYCHHDKVPCLKPADYICKAADAISGGRPGARMESVTNYFERMKELEKCASHFEGVRKVLTMSAGREVRVIVDQSKVKDNLMQSLADDIAEKISEEVSFPGIIKVNLLRITKSADYAREKQRRR